jgi:hypothetical protein
MKIKPRNIMEYIPARARASVDLYIWDTSGWSQERCENLIRFFHPIVFHPNRQSRGQLFHDLNIRIKESIFREIDNG